MCLRCDKRVLIYSTNTAGSSSEVVIIHVFQSEKLEGGEERVPRKLMNPFMTW